MAQNNSKSDVLIHAGNNLDQRTSSETLSTKEQKNSLSAEVQQQMKQSEYPDVTQNVQNPETNTHTTSNQPQSHGKTVDDELDAEDAAELAKKDQAKAQSAAAHGKDTSA